MAFATLLLALALGVYLYDGRTVNRSTYAEASPTPWHPTTEPLCVVWRVEKFRELPTIRVTVHLRDSAGRLVQMKRSVAPGYAKADGEARLYKVCYEASGAKPAPGPAWLIVKQEYQAALQAIRVAYPEVFVQIAE